MKDSKPGDPVSFQTLLTEYMERAGLSDEHLASSIEVYDQAGSKKSGVSRQTVYYYRKGKKGKPVVPRRNMVVALSRALRLSVSEADIFLQAAGYSPEYLNLFPASFNSQQIAPVVGPPVLPHQFFGRQKILGQVFRHYWRSTNVLAIGARKRSGITSLLHYLKGVPKLSVRDGHQRTLSSPLLNHHCVYLNFHHHILWDEGNALAEIVGQIHQTSVSEPLEWKEFHRIISQINRPVTLLIDGLEIGLEKLSESFWCALRAEASAGGEWRLGLILGGRRIQEWGVTGKNGIAPSSLTNIIGETIWDLEPFTHEEAENFLRAIKPELKQTDRLWIMSNKRYLWPAILQMICQEKQNALEYHESDEAWKQQVMLKIEAEQFNELD